MKKTLIFTLLLTLPFILFAQIKTSRDISYKVSKPYKVVDAHHKLYHEKNGKIMVVKVVSAKETVIQKMDAQTLKVISTKSYKDLPDGYRFEDLVEMNDRFFFFFSFYDRKNVKEQLFYQEIDFEKGNFIGKHKLLFKVNGKVTGVPLRISDTPQNFGIMSFGTKEKFDFHKSFDEKKLLIQYRHKPKVKKDTKSKDIIGTHIYDGSMNPVWDKDIKMPYTERRMDNLDYAVDNDGNTFILAKVFKDDSNRDKKKR